MLGLAVGPASAHPLARSRFDAPLPLEWLLAGGGLTVAATAVFVARSGAVPTATRERRLGSQRVIKMLGDGAAAGFFLVLVTAMVAGLLGPSAGTRNLATVFVWPVWIKGVALVAILLGTPWPTLSPWRRLYTTLCWVEGSRIQLRAYPDWLGSWPAVVAVILLVGVAENLTVLPLSPQGTVAVVASYGLWTVAGSVVFGAQWFQRGDPLELLYRQFARVAPIQVRDGEGETPSIRIRPPWVGCSQPVADRGVATVIVVAVYTVSFDGFVESTTYQTVLFATREITGLGPPSALVLYGAGLVLAVGVFALVATSTRRLSELASPWRVIAPTLVPIAAGYELAHNYPYVIRNVGRLPATVGATPIDLLSWLSVPGFWGSQILMVVGGHVIGVVAAHQVVRRGTHSHADALRAHAPLVILMVCYTMVSLWIVSQPVVSG
jgi:hypothetical protein